MSKHGGIVLAGVGLTAACMQIASTTDTKEKNEIFVETITSTSVGLLAGGGITLFLVSNPVGWGTAIVLEWVVWRQVMGWESLYALPIVHLGRRLILSKVPVLTGYANNMKLSDAPLFEQILVITVVTTLLALMLSLVFILIMHILMPRKVLKAYFKEPYFNAGEIAMFTGFPFGYIRTSMFMGILAFPAKEKKEG